MELADRCIVRCPVCSSVLVNLEEDGDDCGSLVVRGCGCDGADWHGRLILEARGRLDLLRWCWRGIVEGLRASV